MRRWLTGRRLLLIMAVLAAAPLAWVYVTYGVYGLVVLLWQGPPVWRPVASTDPRLSLGVQQALGGKIGHPGVLTWMQAEPGFESGQLDVIVDGAVVDSILLARVDPALWRFSVHTAPSGLVDLAGWMGGLNAALVVNGSYFDTQGHPATPVKSAGTLLGPLDYSATHGAFVVEPGGAGIVDLKETDWRPVLAGSRDAMVSYPLLIDAGGKSRAKPSDWLAGRSFIAEDSQGRIIIGTTVDAFFSLPSLASFLRQAPLDLIRALNLDGGPLACQAIAAGTIRRQACGPQEVQVNNGQVSLLTGAFSDRSPSRGLPIVLAITRP